MKILNSNKKKRLIEKLMKDFNLTYEEADIIWQMFNGDDK
jgi:hypothetical protein